MKTATFLGSCVLAIALVVTYVALGGTSYEPTPVANPCAPRPTRPASGTDERLELVVLGVSRVSLALALGSGPALDRLAAKEGKSRDELEQALRDGLVHAVGQAEDENLIGDSTAGALRFAAEHLPLGLLLDLLRRASSIL